MLSLYLHTWRIDSVSFENITLNILTVTGNTYLEILKIRSVYIINKIQ